MEIKLTPEEQRVVGGIRKSIHYWPLVDSAWKSPLRYLLYLGWAGMGIMAGMDVIRMIGMITSGRFSEIAQGPGSQFGSFMCMTIVLILTRQMSAYQKLILKLADTTAISQNREFGSD